MARKVGPRAAWALVVDDGEALTVHRHGPVVHVQDMLAQALHMVSLEEQKVPPAEEPQADA